MHRIRVARTPGPPIAHVVRLPAAARAARAARGRRWRQRGRRAQVSAVATILGLLLVVTFIANYLSTTLPNQMAVNDLEHGVQVENQLGHLRALLQSLSTGGAVGAPALQPIALGSAAAPPFAGSDGGVLSQIAPYSNKSGGTLTPEVGVTLSLASAHYSPPTGWIAGGSYNPAGCSQSPAPPANATSITCGGAGNSQVTYNFTGSATFFVRGNGGAAFYVNFSSNKSLDVVSQTGAGGGFENVGVVGSYNAIYIDGTGGTSQTVTIVGNDNSLTLNTTSKETARVYLIGNYNSVTVNDVPGASSNVLIDGWGSYDSVTPGTGATYSVYFNGFDPSNPNSPICPYGNLATTDTVNPPPGTHTTGTYTVTYNLTSGVPNRQPSPWITLPTSSTPAAPSVCPFFPTTALGGQNLHSATLQVSLRNTYAPAADVAFDEGAVVYAQPGSYPILIDSPGLTYAGGTLSLWIPSFESNLTAEAGIGTASVSLRLVSFTSLSLPSGSWYVNPSIPVRIAYTTPYAYAFETYFAGNPATAPFVSCAPAASVACTGPYQPDGGFATVTLSLPVTTLNLEFSVYSLTVG